MHMASDAYGSILVTFLSVLTKTAEVISDTSGTPVTLLLNTGSKESLLSHHTNLTVKHSLIKESSSTDLLIELKIIVLSVSV
jgi:hypothetical protein